ncbi:NAD(P)H-dependent oxidoreductase [Muricauda sp. NFXS6]|uniref:FMN-dependent NADH-azoreductase n=1 Tax=Allomuricauda sp. NFXS6 TaxID=2819094 RepID=UPI0026176053|nr:NAD(P)H-dependent oxidoreductase [uncultured Allomuricauda sp.]
MKTLLRIDSSFNLQDSFSRQAGDHFEQLWKTRNPEGKVVHRDLAKTIPPHLTHKVYNAFSLGTEGEHALEVSDELVSELEKADEILLGSPVYNYGVPSTLKAYIDHVIRINRTFAYDPKTYIRKGLLENKTANIIVARGGTPINGESPDGVEAYLEGILNFMGIDRVNSFSIYGTTYEGSESGLQSSKKAIKEYFKSIDHAKEEA